MCNKQYYTKVPQEKTDRKKENKKENTTKRK